MPRTRRSTEELRQHVAAAQQLQQQQRARRTTPRIEVMSYGARGSQGAGGATNPHGLHVNKVPPVPLSTMAYAQQTGVTSQQQRSYTAAIASAAGLTLPYSASAAAAISAQQMSANYPINPDVKLKKLPFFDILAELLKPSSLAPQGSGRYQELGFNFSLTPQQANKIANSRDLRPGKQDYNVQVQMRFCLLETSCEQEDNFPPNIAVKINDKMCPLPSPIPTNKPGVEPKRPSRPVNITALCRISPTVTNRVQVSWASEYGRCYVISVYLVQKLSSDDLLHRLKSKGVRIPDFTRSLIKQKLNEDADCEIATTSLRCSLMCPLGKMRMLLPCRANTCNHLQCFDASLYLQMNERKPTWTCPVCDKPAIYDTLVIDGYFQEVLSLNTTSNEVTLHKDGSWTPLVPKKDRPEPQAEKRKSIVAIETLSDSDDDAAPPPSSASGATAAAAAAPSKVVFDDSVVEEVPSNGGDLTAKKKSSSNVEIITLETSSEEEDDDDEEEEEDTQPPMKRPRNEPAPPTNPASDPNSASTNNTENNTAIADPLQTTTELSPATQASSAAPASSTTPPVISASVASSLAQLPAGTSVLATTGEGGLPSSAAQPATSAAAVAAAAASSTAAAVATITPVSHSPGGSDGAKSDDSWSVGTVDPGKRLIFRKSMTCSTNGAGGCGPSSGEPAAPAPTSPTVVSCTPTDSTAAVDLRGADDAASVPPSALNPDLPPTPASDEPHDALSQPPHHEEGPASEHASQETTELPQARPTRTSNRATRFQGITWEGDSETSSDDDFDEDASRDDGAARRGRKRGRSSSGGRCRTTSASSSASAGAGESVSLAAAPSGSPL